MTLVIALLSLLATTRADLDESRRALREDVDIHVVRCRTDDDDGGVVVASDEFPGTFLLDGRSLVATRRLMNSTKPVAAAVARLPANLTAELISVTHKPMAPPSGDLRDYMSLSSYMSPCNVKCNATILRKIGASTCDQWCNKGNNDCNWTAATDAGEPPMYPCNEATGLPWVFHDYYGGLYAWQYDRPRVDRLWTNILPLALQGFYTNQRAALERAALLLRTFFLDPHLGMNPNLNFAQRYPGMYDGVPGGTVDFTRLKWAIESIKLLEFSDPEAAIWTVRDRADIRNWVARLLDWYLNSPNGQAARHLPSDIANDYHINVLSMSLFLDKHSLALAFAKNDSRAMFEFLIAADGSMPVTDADTSDSFGYHSG